MLFVICEVNYLQLFYVFNNYSFKTLINFGAATIYIYLYFIFLIQQLRCCGILCFDKKQIFFYFNLR